MKTIRVLSSGTIVWSMVFTLFLVLSFIPVIQDLQDQQGKIAGVLIILFAYLGALFYYRSGDTTNGLVVGGVMAATALILDALITVPVIEIPANRTYLSFFTNPILWVLVIEDIIVVYLYWLFHVKAHRAVN